jgi:hypothetical protein
MIDRVYGEVGGPLYGAMSISCTAIAWLETQRQEASEFEFQFHLAKLARSMEEFITVTQRNSLHTCPRDIIERLADAAGTLYCMTEALVEQMRQRLPGVSPKFAAPIGSLLDQVDELIDRIEDIHDAWLVALDPTLTAKVDAALSEIDPTKTDIPDWRESLELISN